MGATYPAGAIRTIGETLALSTTAASVGCPPKAYQAIIYNPSVDFRLHLNPAILAVSYYDVSNSAGARFEKYTSTTAVDGTGTVTGSPVSLASGLNTITFTAAGTATVVLPTGGAAVARSGTATLVGTPQTLVAGSNTLDTGATTGTVIIDYSPTALHTDLTDRNTSTGTATAMDSMATGDFLYICTSDILSGFRVVIGSANDQAAVVAFTYWNGAWTGLTETDGTDTGGVSLAKTGSITWAAPTDAVPMSPKVSGNITDADAPGEYGFWWRVAWGAALGTNTEITELWTLNKNTSRGYFRGGQEYNISLDRRNVGAMEAVLAAGTDTAQITWIVPVV